MGVKSFNSADLNNIAKKDGRYNVIENISGAKRTLNPPAAAYSVRKLTGLTGVPYDGPAMRILVDATGDGADATDLEFDINFTADGDLDVADIELKCTGGKDAYVVKWYDQSGAGRDAVQTAYAAMPQICSAGSVITVEAGGKPAVFCADSSDGFDATAGAIDVTARTIYQWSVYSLTGVGNYPTITPSALYEGHDVSTEIPRTGTNRTAFTGVNAASAINTNQAYLRHSYADTTDFKTFLDGSGTAIISGTDTNTDWATSDLQIFDKQPAATGEIKLSEFVMWQSDQSSNRPTIENNINSYFNIYQSRENILPGAAAAYSLRQLSDSSRLAVRVRRDTGVGSGTDDDEADVGFDANGEVSLDSPVSNFDPTGSSATTLGEFLADAAYDDEDSLGSPAEGFVTAWYDQSANANNATQATPDAQPKIYDSSTGLIKENGKPALDWDGTDDVLVTTYSPTVTHTAFFVQVPTTNVVGFLYSSTGTFTNRFWVASTDVNQLQMYRGGSVAYSEGSTLSGQYLGYALNKATTTDIRLGVNGSNVADTGNIGSAVVTNIRVGAEPNSGFYGDSRIQELIIYDSDNSSNRTDIEGNINAHYGIANIGTPSSGLLADYPGSAAAYSVRKLADTAGLAMRIIVDDTAVIGTVDASDTEYDIGFDANGDLDVARIREVCNNPSGANYNAYVVTWYDQSGNGNHATQATYTSCPQIYDGVDVIMENGKTAIKPTTDTQELDFSLASSASGYTLFSVIKESGVASTPSSCLVNILGAGVGGDYILIGTQNSTQTIISQDAGNLSYRLDKSTWTPANRGDVYTAVATGNHLVSIYTDYTGADFGRFGYVFATIAMYQMQEAIFYPSNEFTSGNLSGIETDIDSYYRIYGDPDDGLLSTPYGRGAAAAYSVRRLSNNATRAMRILVDADANGPDASDNEYDIGFDANGELDIARIEELCDKGAGNYDAYVTTWYDQSGNGNDATQTAYASMPKICNAGTVILENGKPAIQWDGVDDTMAASYGSLYSIPCTYSLVHTWPAYPGTFAQMMDGANGIYRHIYRLDNNGTTATAGALTAITFTDNLTDGQQYLSYIDFSGSGGSFVAIDGTVVSDGVTATNSIDGVTLGTTYNFAFDCAFSVQEFIMWPSDQDGAGNRNFIEANINDYFNIEGV